MADFIDKALDIGVGLEKKIGELVVELEQRGQEERGKTEEKQGEGEKAEGGELKPKERLENRIVQEGVRAVKELLNVLKDGKGRVESEACDAAETIAGKLQLATKEELETVKEMARVAREKVDEMEKRLAKIEGTKKKT